MHVVLSHFPDLLSGFLVTVELTVLGYLGALILGTILAVCRIGPITPLRVIGSIYVEVFRNIPLLALLILFVFGLPDVGLTYSFFVSTAICLALSGAAFVCESMRAGINSVAVGQAEAARAIGLTFSKSLRFIILPQAFRSMVQPLVNVFIGVALSSSLASVVGVTDITNRTQFLNLQYAEATATFLVSAAFYIALALLGGGIGGYLERRLAVRR